MGGGSNSSVISSGVQGAASGSALGAWGAAVGGAVGLIGGIESGNKADEYQKQQQQALAADQAKRDQYVAQQQALYAPTQQKLLEEAAPFAGKLHFNDGDVEVIVNDRLLAPNTDATWEALSPEIERFFGSVYGAGRVILERRGEPRERFRVSVKRKA